MLSTHGNGRDWGGDAAASTLDDLKALGAGWVSIHPYASIAADGSVRFREIDVEDPPAYIARPIREAHARGLKILIKPHLAYWGSPFGWRGEIEFEDAGQWSRFWASYSEWIVSLARVAHDADGFVVGTELDRTLDHEREWRSLIAAVREASTAALTYGANWPEFERVPFWDALDAIGIHAYFPLTESSRPSEQEIEAGWARWMERLRRYSIAQRRTVVFTELGYNRSWKAASEPWAYRTDGEDAETLQATCMRIALEAIEREPAVAGAFLWKWFPEPHAVGRNFQLATPAMRRSIRAVWAD